YVTIKYAGSGAPLWTNHYEGPTNSITVSAAIALDGGGNAIVTGYSDDPASGYGYDYATIKYSSVGVALWTNSYNGAGNSHDFATSLAVDGGGNVFVTGYSDDNNTGISSFATVAYSVAGVALWTNVYFGPVSYTDTANAVAVDTSSNVFITGSSAGSFATIN